jgi:methylenetetrahydrofolate--tRNA-(uracil-5-)-methyltransferase
MGLLAGRFAAAERLGRALPPPPAATAMGALLRHITHDAESSDFQPMNANFGLFPPLDPPVKKKQRKAAYAARALADLDAWLGADPDTARVA